MEWRLEPANCISNRAVADGCLLEGPTAADQPHRITMQMSLTATPA